MSREDKEGFRLSKKPIKVTPSKKEEDVKTSQLMDNHFYSLSKETKYHSIPSYLYPEKKMSADIDWSE